MRADAIYRCCCDSCEQRPEHGRTLAEWIASAERIGGGMERPPTYRATLRGKANGRIFGLYEHLGILGRSVWFIQGLERLRFVEITPDTLETLLATGELTLVDRKEAACIS